MIIYTLEVILKVRCFFLCSILCLSFGVGTGCSKAPVNDTGAAIINGTNSAKAGIGMLVHGASKYTASEIKSRCILTSGSVAGVDWIEEELILRNTIYFRQQAPDIATSNRVRAIRGKKHASPMGLPVECDELCMAMAGDCVDLAVIWLKPKECDANLQNCITVSWNPLTLATALPVPSTNVDLEGYGSKDWLLATSGRQRMGTMEATNPRTCVGEGSTFDLLETVAAQNVDLSTGDLGAPAFIPAAPNEILGIVGIDALFPSPKVVGMVGGNRAWIQARMGDYCIPKVKVSVSVSSQDMGKVIGTANGVTVINCGLGSTLCSMPATQNYSVTLTATPAPTTPPAPSYRFLGWFGDACPCAGSQNPQCVVDVNTYESQLPRLPGEEVLCGAAFGM